MVGTAPRLESLAPRSRGGSRDREEVSRRAPPSPVPDGQRRASGDPAKGDAKPPTCLGCGGSISGSYLVAPGNRRGAYHARCLRCEVCAEPTERFIVVDEGPNGEGSGGRTKNKNVTRDVLVCARCHDERFAEKCGKCRLPLRGTILTALGSKFHAECFRCSLCDASLASGTFVQMPNEKKAACASCHERELAAKCGGCGRGVVGDHVVALGGTPFHKACFCCVRCRASLVGRKHVPHEGKAWCAECHVAAFAERCGCGCGRGVSGDVVVALGKRFLAGHFACAECRGPFPNGDFMKVDVANRNTAGSENVALSPNRGGDARVSFAETKTPRDPTKGVRVAAVSVAVCRACYASNHAERCACCAVPLVGCRFVRVDSGMDEGAAAENENAENASTTTRKKKTGQAMCLACDARPGSLCDDCGRCVSNADRVLGAESEKTARRRSGGIATIGQCGACRSTAVTSDEAAKKMLADVAAALERVGARDAPPAASRDVVVRLVDADRLASAARTRHRGPSADGPRGVTRTKVELRGTAPKERWAEIVDGWRLDRRVASETSETNDDERTTNALPRSERSPTRSVAATARPDVSDVSDVRESRRIEDVLLLRGMSRTATGATLAHEFGHCYLFARAFPALPLKTEEGVCELFAWLWLGGGLSVPAATRATLNGADEAHNARRRARMEKRQDPVYGDGFRDAKKALERCGGNLWTLLEHVRVNAALPT